MIRNLTVGKRLRDIMTVLIDAGVHFLMDRKRQGTDGLEAARRMISELQRDLEAPAKKRARP